MASAPATACSACGKQATNKCSGCSKTASTTRYCSTECQTIDWPKHKVACKELQLEHKIKRAAIVVRETWLRFREIIWYIPIKKVIIRDKEIVMYKDYKKEGTGLFVEFPEELMPNNSVKESLLCNLSCGYSLAVLHTFIAQLLKGLAVDIHEISVGLKKPPRVITTINPDGTRQANWPRNSHELLRVTYKKTGKMWYVDMTGSQYGLCEAFSTAVEFNTRYVEDIVRVSLFGKNKEYLEACAKLNGPMGLLAGSILDAARVLDLVIERGLNDQTFSCSALLSANDAEAGLHKDAFMDIATGALTKFVVDADYSKELRAASRVESELQAASRAESDRYTADTLGQLIMQDIRKKT